MDIRLFPYRLGLSLLGKRREACPRIGAIRVIDEIPTHQSRIHLEGSVRMRRNPNIDLSIQILKAVGGLAESERS